MNSLWEKVPTAVANHLSTHLNPKSIFNLYATCHHNKALFFDSYQLVTHELCYIQGLLRFENVDTLQVQCCVKDENGMVSLTPRIQRVLKAILNLCITHRNFREGFQESFQLYKRSGVLGYEKWPQACQLSFEPIEVARSMVDPWLLKHNGLRVLYAMDSFHYSFREMKMNIKKLDWTILDTFLFEVFGGAQNEAGHGFLEWCKNGGNLPEKLPPFLLEQVGQPTMKDLRDKYFLMFSEDSHVMHFRQNQPDPLRTRPKACEAIGEPGLQFTESLGDDIVKVITQALSFGAEVEHRIYHRI